MALARTRRRRATSFSVSLIPHTRGETTLADKTVGETVNLENDVLAKYVEKLLRPRADEDAPTPRSGGLTLDFLRANGFYWKLKHKRQKIYGRV